MTWPHGDPNVAVRSILSQPAFRVRVAAGVPAQPSPFELAWKWFADHVLAPLFGPIARAVGANHGAGTAIGAALAGLALLALGWVAFRFLVIFMRPSAAAVAGARSATVPVGAARSSGAWRETARGAARRGDYATAIAALFSAALAALDEAALVPFDASRTPGEYRKLVYASRAPAGPPFDELAERFVRAAYARSTPLRADFEAAQRAYAAFEPATRT